MSTIEIYKKTPYVLLRFSPCNTYTCATDNPAHNIIHFNTREIMFRNDNNLGGGVDKVFIGVFDAH